MLIVLRLLGGWLVVFAVIGLVYDATRSNLAGLPFRSTSIAEHWRALAAKSFDGFREMMVAKFGAFAWDPLATALLGVPAWAALAVIGIGFYWLGRKRQRLNIFAN